MWYSRHPTYTDKITQVASSTFYVSAVPLCQFGSFPKNSISWRNSKFAGKKSSDFLGENVSTSKNHQKKNGTHQLFTDTFSFSLFTGLNFSTPSLRWFHDVFQLHLNKGIRNRNPGWLIGILIMACYSPYITGYSSTIPKINTVNNQVFLFIAQMVIKCIGQKRFLLLRFLVQKSSV